jgi:hypothetical protein
VTPRVIDSELGQALGFQAYRYEAQLLDDEALIVHELVTIGSRKIEAEYAAVGTGGKATYDLVLVDSGFFHPTLRNTDMLRFPTSAGSVDDVVLTGSSQGPDGIEFIFSDPRSFEVKITRRWSASVEKHDDVRKRWPELPLPRNKILSGSRRLIVDTAPDPATPASISTHTSANASTTSRVIPFPGDGLEMLQAGAAKDNVAAQVALGAAYYSGEGVAKDLIQAAHWWRKAADLGDATAQHNLAAMYANGYGVDQDWDLARIWYLKSAAQGNARSQSNLAPITQTAGVARSIWIKRSSGQKKRRIKASPHPSAISP